MAKVLLVDDEVTMVQLVSESLRALGHEVFPFSNGAAAMKALVEKTPEIVVTDLYLDKTRAHGLDILKQAREMESAPVVIVITGFGSIETAVEAMKLGAFDYLEKPFKLDELKLSIERALSYNQAVSENVYLRKQLKTKYHFSQIIGVSEPMQAVFKMIERIAETDSTALILGESGTGKELVAKAIHFNSRRKGRPFVPVNCSAIPENLLESELFGHRKGAFTGAVADKKGLFEEAEGGTIFLDEIGSMSPTLQSRLLRVLQEKEVRRVGDNIPIYVDVRVVAATNEPLEERIKDGTFREDLYYRLNVIPVHLPSLRDRRDDIPLLVGHFLKDKIHPRSGNVFQVTKVAVDTLGEYDWPGNVRELENIVERACALSDSHIIRTEDLPPSIAKLSKGDDRPSESDAIAQTDPATEDTGLYPLPKSSNASLTVDRSGESAGPLTLQPLKEYLRQQEAIHLNRVLTHTGGDKEAAAELLDVSLATLYRKLAEHEDR